MRAFLGRGGDDEGVDGRSKSKPDDDGIDSSDEERGASESKEKKHKRSKKDKKERKEKKRCINQPFPNAICVSLLFIWGSQPHHDPNLYHAAKRRRSKRKTRNTRKTRSTRR